MHGTLKPLHCACMVADADCVELLLQKGAEVNTLETPLINESGAALGCEPQQAHSTPQLKKSCAFGRQPGPVTFSASCKFCQTGSS